jgi:hypothetical protein
VSKYAADNFVTQELAPKLSASGVSSSVARSGSVGAFV